MREMVLHGGDSRLQADCFGGTQPGAQSSQRQQWNEPNHFTDNIYFNSEGECARDRYGNHA
jgi:hypothetical protein